MKGEMKMDTQTVIVSIKDGEVVDIQTVEHVKVEVRDYDVDVEEIGESLLENDENGKWYRVMGSK
jgi:hypothetical protein